VVIFDSGGLPSSLPCCKMDTRQGERARVGGGPGGEGARGEKARGERARGDRATFAYVAGVGGVVRVWYACGTAVPLLPMKACVPVQVRASFACTCCTGPCLYPSQRCGSLDPIHLSYANTCTRTRKDSCKDHSSVGDLPNTTHKRETIMPEVRGTSGNNTSMRKAIRRPPVVSPTAASATTARSQ
jgi:hypothetical protein